MWMRFSGGSAKLGATPRDAGTKREVYHYRERTATMTEARISRGKRFGEEA